MNGDDKILAVWIITNKDFLTQFHSESFQAEKMLETLHNTLFTPANSHQHMSSRMLNVVGVLCELSKQQKKVIFWNCTAASCVKNTFCVLE